MVCPSLYTSISPHPDAEAIWRLLDYGRLSEQGRESTGANYVSAPTHNLVPQEWTSTFLTPLPNFDMTGYGNELLS
jgi:hypothetical protein